MFALKGNRKFHPTQKMTLMPRKENLWKVKRRRFLLLLRSKKAKPNPSSDGVIEGDKFELRSGEKFSEEFLVLAIQTISFPMIKFLADYLMRQRKALCTVL